MDALKIEERLDKVVGGAIEISQDIGGIRFETMMQVMEFAKMLSLSGAAIPKHLRNEPGACLGIVVQALEWRFSPYFVANKSYFVNDRLAYEAQLLHAVVLTRAPIKNNEAHVEYSGEAQKRRARIWVELTSGGIKEYETPEVGTIPVKNSPLWKGDVDQQLFYYGSRGLARRHFPHVLGGVYSKDELEGSEDNTGPDKAKDVTPKPSIGERLKGNKGRGFDAKHIEKQTAQTILNPAGATHSADGDGAAGEETRAAVNAASPAEAHDAETGEVAEFGAADAMEMGRLAFREKRSNRPPEEWRDGKNDAFAEAFKAGFDDEEAAGKK